MQKYANMWRINSMLLNEERSIGEINKEMKKFLETRFHMSSMFPHICLQKTYKNNVKELEPITRT